MTHPYPQRERRDALLDAITHLREAGVYYNETIQLGGVQWGDDEWADIATIVERTYDEAVADDNAEPIRWQDPPQARSGRGNPGRWDSITEQLVANPGRWAIVHEANATGGGGPMQVPRRAFMSRGYADTDFEITSRTDLTGDTMAVYARYVGHTAPEPGDVATPELLAGDTND